MSQRKLIAPILLFLLWLPSGKAAGLGPSIGPLYDKSPLTFAEGARHEAVGPFFQYEVRLDQRQWAIPPLLSGRNDPGLGQVEFDLLYPILTYDRFGGEHRFQILQFLSFSGGRLEPDEANRRITLFPVYFQQRSPDPNLDYTALVPIHGTLKNRFFRDEIRFTLFPLYAQSKRRDVVTDNYLYPIFHLRKGDNLRGWQVWPLAGRETRASFSRTNRFDELEVVGGYDKSFVLWPLYLSQTAGIGTDNPQRTRGILPLYTSFRSETRRSITAPWPIGITYTDDRAAGYREYGAPWPLVVFARGENRHISRVWPLFSHARTDALRNDFYLWPLYTYRRVDSPPLERERRRILFFLYSDLVERTLEGPEYRRRTDLWPFFTRNVDFEGRQRLQILAPLEPILPNNKSIERNYSPLWSLWRAERDSRTGASSQSLLWNLYRRDTSSDQRKFSLLFGLVQYQSGMDGRSLRLFYVPLSRREAE